MASTTLKVPASVPAKMAKECQKNYSAITRDTGKLMIFAGDQRMEHVNADFWGEDVSAEDATPDHLFEIAKAGDIGVFATQFGLLSQYAKDYPEVNYLVKINSKTNLVSGKQQDPLSLSLAEIADVLELKKEVPTIRGIGYTVYLGSAYEAEMLAEVGHLFAEAHAAGLVTVLWAYPRGASVVNEKDPHVIAGACATAAALGADFVKVTYPEKAGKKSEEIFKEAVLAAGRTGVLCAGGEATKPEEFFSTLYQQLNISGAAGSATGRNVHQKPLAEAVKMTKAISAMVYRGASAQEALEMYKKNGNTVT